jgi:uncharacterized protein
MKFVDSAEITGARKTTDGYLVASVLCARTGCQDYLGTELGLEDSRVVPVYRPKNVVFDRASMESYVGKPVTIDHPSEPVTAQNWSDLAKGDILSVVPEGEYIRADIKIMDAAAIEAIENGKREISMGYSTGLEIKDGIAPDGTKYGAIQTGPIKVNHLAIVDRARGGSNLRIGDGAEHWGASPLTDAVQGKENHMPELRKIMVDGLQVETTDAGAQAIDKLTGQLADSKKAITDAAVAHQAALDAKDAELAAKDAEIEKLKGSQISDADLDARIEARASLIDTARKINPDLDPKGLSDSAIRKAAVAAKLGDAGIAGKSDAYIEASFDIMAKDAAAPVDQFAETVSHGIQPTTDYSVADKAYAENVTNLQDAWKGAPAKQEA